MSVRVADYYALEQSGKLDILTGNSGIERELTGISLLDYELSEKELGQIKDKFVISSFIFAKDDYEKVHNVICALADNGAVALGIKNVYCRNLKQETIDYAKKRNFSIFMFGHDVYYENIITDVHKMLRGSKDNKSNEQKATKIVALGRETEKLRELIFSINSFFNEKHLVVYLKAKDQNTIKNDIDIIEKIEKQKMLMKQESVFSFRKGFMYIATSSKVVKNTAEDSLRYVEVMLSSLGFELSKHYIGVSEVLDSMDFIDITMRESMFAVNFCELQNKDIVCFDKLGLYRIAFPLVDSPWGRRYCKDVIGNIKAYDEEHNTDLMDTALAYIENYGNIKKTSEDTWQHENTIRYKVKKIKEIMGVPEERDTFYIELHMAIVMGELLGLKK